MSNLERIRTVQQLVDVVEVDFKKLAVTHQAVHYDREASFAMQAMKNNSYLCGVAYSNQDSLKMAIVNVAAIGLTLNPVRRLAYLVPRDKKVILDISYLGFIQLAIDVGAIQWATAEVVYEQDVFHFQGLGVEPSHQFNPFSKDRGEIVGAYCVAKTHGDDFLTEMMAIDEIYSIRDRSVSYRAWQKDNGKKTPWITDPTEMIRKTVVKRAFKYWPMTDTSQRSRMDRAIDVNAEETAIVTGPTPEETEARAQRLVEVRGKLEFLGREETQALGYLERIVKRKVEAMEDLTSNEIERFSIMLDGFIEKKEAEETANTGDENEDAEGSEQFIGEVQSEVQLPSGGSTTGE